MLLLLSGDISLNSGPTPNSVSKSFWKHFENKGVHFLHLNINSILLKLDELKTIAGNTKAAIIGIKESKLAILYLIVRLKLQVTAFFDVIEIEMGEELHVMLGRIYGNIEGYFLISCYLRQNQSLKE